MQPVRNQDMRRGGRQEPFAQVPPSLLAARHSDGRKLSDRAKVMWVAVKLFDWGEGAFPSVKLLAECCDFSKAKARGALHELVAARLLVVQNRFADDGRQTSNEYVLVLPEGGAGSGTPPLLDPAPDVYRTATRKSGSEGGGSLERELQDHGNALAGITLEGIRRAQEQP